MELVYLWIEDYKNIKNQGFNFSPRFECDYNKNSNKLTIEPKNYTSIFPKNINITAIVGENGSGKSSLAQCIAFNHFTKLQNSKEILFVYLYNDKYYAYTENINIDKIESNKKLYKLSKNINHLFTIYYSSNKSWLDPRSDFEQEKNQNSIIYEIDITDYSLYQKYALEIQEIGNTRLDSFLDVWFFARNQDIKNNLELFKQKNINFPNDFQKPNNIYISLNISYIKNKFEEINRKSSLQDIINVISDNQSNYFLEFIQLLNKKENIFNIENDFKKILKIIDIYSKLLKKSKIDFLDFRYDILLSSGQEQILNLLSRIYIKFLEINKQQNKKSVIIVLDEPDVYLHPNWQKQFLNILIYFLTQNFTDINFHFIFTTHSPFLLSDLPKENIIFLNKDENGNCKNVTKETDINTFGANIHTLLSNGFFMKDGLIGEFAKGKIDEVIKILNQNKLNDEDLKYCEQIISIIGEPIIKRQLQKTIDSKRLRKIDKIDELEDEIEFLKYRIDLLSKRL